MGKGFLIYAVHDLLSIYYIDEESCHPLSETPPVLYIKHLSK